MKKIVILLLWVNVVFAQSNLLNNSRVYEFLEQQYLLGRIDYNTHIKPLSRQFIENLLTKLAKYENDFNAAERSEYKYFLEEYSMPQANNEQFNFIEENSNGAFRVFEYAGKDFNVTVYPDFGGSVTIMNESRSRTEYYNGLSAYGSSGNFSFDIDFNDFTVVADGYDYDDGFKNIRGTDYPRDLRTGSFNNDRTLGNISYSWGNGFVSLKRGYNEWGTGFNSKLIFSDRAPAFPQIYLNYRPTDWLEFNYFYGELNSAVYDSTTTRITGTSRDHIENVPKYIASHAATFNFIDNIKFTIGESVVISDNFQSIYLIPVLFFRIADHYTSNSDENSNNAQIFSAVSYRIPSLSMSLNAGLFIDEYSFSNLFGGDYSQRIGLNFGIKKAGFIFNNLSMELEYTKINPYVYSHADPAQTFENKNYKLGHYIEENSDQVYLAFKYIPVSRLYTKASVSYTRKGSVSDSKLVSDEPKNTFLYGDKSYYVNYELFVEYEYFNNIFLYCRVAGTNSWGINNVINIDDHKYVEGTTGFKIGF